MSTAIAAPDAPNATTTCPGCSQKLASSTSFCSQCGKEIGESLGRRSNVRWVILALIFIGTTINYVDRSVLSMLGAELDQKWGINDRDFTYITAAFSFAYAIGQMGAGHMLDRLGTRLGYSIALVGWSISSMLHALVRTALGFGIVRVLLGITESPGYPGATKVTAEWFPRRERALAMGWVNGGSNVGMLIAAGAVPFITARYGIAAAFIFTGGLGLLFVIAWMIMYRTPEQHSRITPAELAYIRCDPIEATTRFSWRSLLGYRQTWSFVASKFLTDSMWGFFIFLAPKFLSIHHHLDIKSIGLPMVIIYLVADLGSIGGGWLSSFMIRHGSTINVARKVTMLICAICVLPVIGATSNHLWISVSVIGLAMAAHQGFSANQYTMVSDMFPRRAVGSVAGLGGSIGYFGAAFQQLYSGSVLTRTHGDYQTLFTIAAFAYLVSLLIIHAFAPRLERVQLSAGDAPAPA